MWPANCLCFYIAGGNPLFAIGPRTVEFCLAQTLPISPAFQQEGKVDAITVIGSRALLRAGLVSLLNAIGDFESIREADDINGLRSSGAELSPHSILICLARGAGDIIGTAATVKAWEPSARIVFVLPKLDFDLMSACFAAGACSCLLETISRDGLRESLRLVDAGEKVFSSELASFCSMLTPKLAHPEQSDSERPNSNLSPREIEILRCLTDGQSNKVIAKRLAIAEATVKIHIKRIMRKTQVINRTQAAVWGIAAGMAATPPRRNSEDS
jgi:two-component system nitrate/nitrite response regulator NarL